MVAVCWVLVTKFDCTIKGGFVRDWVIGNRDKLSAGNNLKKIMGRNNLNGHIEVIDESVSPMDIDA